MIHTNRRTFLKTLGIAGAVSMLGLPAWALRETGLKRFYLLHTNDTHSRLDPFPDNDPNYPGMGGYARRAARINHLRREDPNLILLDAGDIFQGTPYYNMYGGEPELKLMSRMGYDAAAFGNHEFDNGMDGFLHVLPHAEFPFLAANYDFSNTPLAGHVGDHILLHRNGITVGIYGLGIDPGGLVGRNLYGDTTYLDPIEKAREMEDMLWKKHGCEVIICLSHLGFEYNSDRVSDVKLAQHTKNTDIIIGGHTHRLLDPPARVQNMEDRDVVIGQAGHGGLYLGEMTVWISEEEGEKFIESYTTLF